MSNRLRLPLWGKLKQNKSKWFVGGGQKALIAYAQSHAAILLANGFSPSAGSLCMSVDKMACRINTLRNKAFILSVRVDLLLCEVKTPSGAAVRLLLQLEHCPNIGWKSLKRQPFDACARFRPDARPGGWSQTNMNHLADDKGALDIDDTLIIHTHRIV